jgi:hypothetical protein
VRLLSGVCTMIPNGYYVHSTCSVQGGFLAFYVDPQCTIRAKMISFLQNMCISSSAVNSISPNCTSSHLPASRGPMPTMLLATTPPLSLPVSTVTPVTPVTHVVTTRKPPTLRVIYTLFHDQACAINSSSNVTFLFGTDLSSCAASSNGFFVYGTCDGAGGFIKFFSDQQCSSLVSTVTFANRECITFDNLNSAIFSCHYLSEETVNPSSASSSSSAASLTQGTLIAVVVCSIAGVSLVVVAMQVNCRSMCIRRIQCLTFNCFL